MKKVYMIVIFLMAVFNNVWAEDKLTISDFKISAGETKEVSISLDSDDDYVAFQFDFYLPKEITVESYSANSSRVPESTTLNMSLQTDGSYRFLTAAMEVAPLVGTTGNIITLTVKASENTLHGELTGFFRNIKLAKADATGKKYDEMQFPIKILEPSVVTVTNVSRIYGDTNPVFKYNVTGGKLEGEPIITCEATTTSLVGDYPIKIARGSVTNYNVTWVDGTLTVTKAPLSVKAGTYTKKQGEDNPEFTLTYEGWKNNETEVVLTKKPTATTIATKESVPGEYEVTVSGGEAKNYELSYTNGKLIVSEADAVIITAKSYTREYGESNPTFEYTSAGATLVGVPETTCEATAASPVGTYPIVIKKGTITNYNDTYVNGTLTIIKAPLTVKVENVTREQYVENPEFIITYIGWKLDEDESVLTKKPIVTTSATKDSPVGEYDIVVSGGEAKNYDLKYQNGVLTIIESTGIATISVTNPANVYNIQGRMVRPKATTLEGLPIGVYIINGKKVVLK